MPSYTHPLIQEAIFDFKTRNELSTFNENLKTSFSKNIDEDYSFKDTLRIVNINPITDKTEQPEIVGYRFASSDNEKIVEFRKNGFTFNRLKNYDGWKKNFKETLKFWKHYCKEINVKVVTRVSTRFINRFQIPEMSITPDKYFNIFIKIFNENIAWNQTTCRLLLFHGTNVRSKIIFHNNFNSVTQKIDTIFDIDVFSDNLNLSKDEHFEKIFNNLRKIKNNIFEQSITDKIREMIK